MGAKIRATVVGIDEYGDPFSREQARLRYASKDARAVADLLKNSQVFSEETITLLENKAATRMAVRESLKNTFTNSRSFDTNTIALFYFAGHGIVSRFDEHISLGCHDVNFADPEVGSIRLNDIYDWVSASSAECVIVILDACFSGGIMVGDVNHQLVAQRALQAIEFLRHKEGKTIAIFAACTSKQDARESSAIGHGIFTNELIRGWRGEAKEKDDYVYLSGLKNFLTQNMARYRQAPQFSLRDSRPFPLWYVEPSVSAVAIPSAPVPLSSSVIPVKPPSKAAMVYVQPKLPVAVGKPISHIQDRNKIIIGVLLAVLIALAVLTGIILLLISVFHHFIH